MRLRYSGEGNKWYLEGDGHERATIFIQDLYVKWLVKLLMEGDPDLEVEEVA